MGTSGEGCLCRGGASGTPSGGDHIDSIDCGAGIEWVTLADVTGVVKISVLAVAVPVTAMQGVSVDESSAGVISFDTTSTIVDHSTGGTNTVVRTEKRAGALGAAGTTVFINDTHKSVCGVPFTTDATTVTRRVYMPRPGADVRARMKLEYGNKVLQTIEADAFTTDAEDWQTLTFDFASAASNGPNDDPTERLKVDYSFDKVSLFFNFGMSTAQGGGTFSFDDLKFVKSPNPSGVIADDGFGNTENIVDAESVLGSAFCDRTPAATARTRSKVRPATTPSTAVRPSTLPASATRSTPAPTSTRSPTSTRLTTSCS